ncbi:MAG: hypothetical protein WAO29_01370 [Candidatus Nanopelagicales bacterium]
MARSIEEITYAYQQLKQRYRNRDSRWSDVLEVRKGNINNVFPGLFPAEYPKPMVANFIDVAARDIAEVIAPLPAINCSSSNAVSDRARAKADKRTMIAAGYRDQSHLQTQMFTGADRYITFGALPFIVEADYENNTPVIRIDNPFNSYPEFDRFGRLLSYTKYYQKPLQDLVNDFPEHESAILGPTDRRGSLRPMQLVRYMDKDQTVLFLPERGNYVLEKAKNPLGKLNVVMAIRPGVDSDDDQRGQFDDVLWVQVARSRFATLQLEAAQKSVQAPFALPNDVNILEMGPDSTIRSASPEKIRRVDLNVPPGLFTESAILDQEMRMGSRYPEGRQGMAQGSIVTGRGVEALMGGFDTQVKTAQQVLAEALSSVFSLAFEMDEKLFGDIEKTVRGVDSGAPYEVTYTPRKDIDGEYVVDVTYGLMAGLNPNQALVFGLQARGDQLISRDFLRRQMPFEMNVTQEEQKIEVEKLRDSLVSAIGAYAQAIPSLVTQGQDPGEILERIAVVIDGRQRGTPIEQVIAKAFAPQAPPQSEAVAAPGEEQPVPGSPGEAPAGGASGLSAATGGQRGIAPGQVGQGGRPPMQMLLAGLTGGGNPTLASSVQRMVPAG